MSRNSPPRQRRTRVILLQQLEMRCLLAADDMLQMGSSPQRLQQLASPVLSALPDPQASAAIGKQLAGETAQSLNPRSGPAYDMIDRIAADQDSVHPHDFNSQAFLQSLLDGGDISDASQSGLDTPIRSAQSLLDQYRPASHNQSRAAIAPWGQLDSTSTADQLLGVFAPQQTIILDLENTAKPRTSPPTTTQSTNEGASVELPISLPGVTPPAMRFFDTSSLDDFAPIEDGENYAYVDTIGLYNTSTMAPDSTLPGTHWVHQVNQQVTSPTQWIYHETLVMSFNETNFGTDADSVNMEFAQVGCLVIAFQASRGVSTDPLAGVAWSLSLSTVDTVTFNASNAGNSTATSTGHSSTATSLVARGPSGDGNEAWDLDDIPDDYDGESSWSGNAGLSVSANAQFVLKSTPSLVVTPNGNETDRAISAVGIVGRDTGFNASTSSLKSASSGNLAVDPLTIDPLANWSSTDVLPPGGFLGIDPQQAQQTINTDGPDGFSPFPQYTGSGSAMTASRSTSLSSNTGGSLEFDISGTIRNDRLTSIAGELLSNASEQMSDGYHDNYMYHFQNDVSESDGDTTTEIKARIAYGWNLSPSVAASITNEHRLGLSVDGNGTLISTTIAEFASTDFSSSTQDLDFIGIDIQIAENSSSSAVTGEPEVSHIDETLAGKLSLSNVFLSTGEGSLEAFADESTPLASVAHAKWDDAAYTFTNEEFSHTLEVFRDARSDPDESNDTVADISNAYKNLATSTSKSSGDITLTLGSNNDIVETGAASNSWIDEVDYELKRNALEILTIYWSPGQLESYNYWSSAENITESLQQTASGGAAFDSSVSADPTESPTIILGDLEPIITGEVITAYGWSGGSPGHFAEPSTNESDLLDWLSAGISSIPVFGSITDLTTPLLAPMVQSTVGDQFLLETSGEGLVLFTVGAAAATVLSGYGAAGAVSATGCTVSGYALAGSVSATGEYLAVLGMANAINPVANDPTVQGAVATAASGAALGMTGKWLGLVGCFAKGTEVALAAIARCPSLERELWSESAELFPAPSCHQSEWQGSAVGSRSAPVTNRRLSLPIESVPLGSLISTQNPKSWEIDDSLPQPDETDWRLIKLTIERTDGAIVDVQLLRPDGWVRQQRLTVGSRPPFQIPELDIAGWATIHWIGDCPRLAEGEGNFVTGCFVTREVQETAILTLENGATLEATPIHPIWSIDREDWVAIGDLEPGERLQAASGPLCVASLGSRNRPTTVYNLEVHGHHVYQVGEDALLVHNACSHSKILGRNMAGGEETLAAAIRQQGYQAGHVIPAAGFSNRIQPVVQAVNSSREVLARVGLDIDDPANGFWTKNNRHLGSHTNKFLLDAWTALEKVKSKTEAAGVLDQLKGALFGGDYL